MDADDDDDDQSSMLDNQQEKGRTVRVLLWMIFFDVAYGAINLSRTAAWLLLYNRVIEQHSGIH